MAYLGEIRLFAGNFAPTGWALCNGQLLPISENTALFTLVGTTYGGDGQSTFALPELRGRAPVHQGTLAGGTSFTMGESAGAETVTLTAAQMAAHGHALAASTADGVSADPTNAAWAASDARPFNTTTTGLQAMHDSSLQVAGGTQPHENRMPFGALTFIIAVSGVFPSQS